MSFNKGHWIILEVVFIIVLFTSYVVQRLPRLLLLLSLLLPLLLLLWLVKLRCWLGLLVLCDFTLLNIVIILHHLCQSEDLLANLYRLLLVFMLLALKVLCVRFLILRRIFREQDILILIQNV